MNRTRKRVTLLRSFGRLQMHYCYALQLAPGCCPVLWEMTHLDPPHPRTDTLAALFSPTPSGSLRMIDSGCQAILAGVVVPHPPAGDTDKCSESARIFWKLGHSAQLRELAKFLDDDQRLYKYRRGPTASSLGGGHLAGCVSEVECGRQDDGGRGVHGVNGREEFWAALNNEVLRAVEGEARWTRSRARTQARGKREISEETPRTSGIVRHAPTCEYPGVTQARSRPWFVLTESRCSSGQKIEYTVPVIPRHDINETLGWSGARMQARGKREYPEKTRRQVASSSTIPTCENSGVNPPGTEPGSPWWEANTLATVAPLPHFLYNNTAHPVFSIIEDDNTQQPSAHFRYRLKTTKPLPFTMYVSDAGSVARYQHAAEGVGWQVGQRRRKRGGGRVIGGGGIEGVMCARGTHTRGRSEVRARVRPACGLTLLAARMVSAYASKLLNRRPEDFFASRPALPARKGISRHTSGSPCTSRNMQPEDARSLIYAPLGAGTGRNNFPPKQTRLPAQRCHGPRSDTTPRGKAEVEINKWVPRRGQSEEASVPPGQGETSGAEGHMRKRREGGRGRAPPAICLPNAARSKLAPRVGKDTTCSQKLPSGPAKASPLPRSTPPPPDRAKTACGFSEHLACCTTNPSPILYPAADRRTPTTLLAPSENFSGLLHFPTFFLPSFIPRNNWHSFIHKRGDAVVPHWTHTSGGPGFEFQSGHPDFGFPKSFPNKGHGLILPQSLFSVRSDKDDTDTHALWPSHPYAQGAELPRFVYLRDFNDDPISRISICDPSAVRSLEYKPAHDSQLTLKKGVAAITPRHQFRYKTPRIQKSQNTSGILSPWQTSSHNTVKFRGSWSNFRGDLGKRGGVYAGEGSEERKGDGHSDGRCSGHRKEGM
ncbi:hypothetical protein PR048_007797 [Dryococelus australis]|uniref:Uncharacterized protein n=1 Tax=Dryococelus australis TaxID=614101 RepID=A0ABQ9HW69_9NEOP|nr:hypothetical protein PR048_007797 [Dryococelus australis]